MKIYAWNEEKNKLLKAERGVSFEEVILHIATGDLLDIVEHPHVEKYKGQRIFIVKIHDYAWLVPFLESEEEIFLKTIIPSRKATKKISGEMNEMNHNLKLEPGEQELLESYERDEWQSVTRLQEKLRQYQSYATSIFESMGLVSIALPPEDLKALREKAAAMGISYQTLIANILHQYVTGGIVEKLRSH